jgi:hypothetical protein
MVPRTHNTSEMYSILPAPTRPSRPEESRGSPGARKDGPSFFALFIKQLFGNTDERRTMDRKEANAEEEAWKESTRRGNEKRRRANRLEWIAHHGMMNAFI